MLPLPREIPLFRIAIAIVFGILIQNHLNASILTIQALLGLSFLILLSLHFIKTLGPIHYVRAGVLYVCFALLSGLLYQQKLTHISHPFLKENEYTEKAVIVECISRPKSKSLTQFYAKITHIQKDSNQYISIRPVNVLVHLFENSTEIEIGDVLHFKDIIKKTSQSSSPMAFDYRRYLKYKGVSYQTFLSTEDIMVIEKRGAPWNERVRMWAIALFQEKLSSDNIAIASALVLGYRGFINDDLYESFAQTGSMHVLAVSGLHVGIVSWLLGLILKRIRVNYRYVKVCKSIVLLSCIWTFAFITGGSSSVLRASTMFSLFELSRIWKGHFSTYNSIGAAATILLLIDPFCLFHVGFQLSFAAILSIIFFCHRISNLFSFENYFLQKIWGLLSVAISVQILTFPISIYYFHQFPVYFPITGVSAVLLASAILSYGILLLLISSIGTIDFLFKPLDWLVTGLRTSTEAIHKWPYGLIESIPYDEFCVIGIYVGIAFVVTFMINRKLKYLLFGLIIFCGLFLRHQHQKNIHHSQNEYVIYDTRHSLIDIFIGDKVYSYADPNLTEKNITFATEGYRIHKRSVDVFQCRDHKEFKKFLAANYEVISELPKYNNNDEIKQPTKESSTQVTMFEKPVWDKMTLLFMRWLLFIL